ncbi:hypothetical protein GWO43_06305 [candidate division KSB1 bacterium]|nr:hypothetical protein [candidate division KSB1 bacterium]NIR72386.1 hypothetical protein [candidate division KSB1 bacterium]NIS23572.1 hypothetical protein [candidate division KSB1 bacterium]NIT70501.1 hypothetical protein [candidate division KSB1 bacterium]NIU24206.1 hypothetical protein [candidate division KSB1 bacterium]
MKNKILNFLVNIPFYLSNLIILVFVFDAVYLNKSLENLFVIFATLLGIIGALSGLCYTGASSQTDELESKIYRISGDRYLHSFLMGIFAFVFFAGSAYVQEYGIFRITDKVITATLSIVFVAIAFFSLVWSGRSFMIGFHMMRKTLNQRFPLKDEQLFDDIEKD